MTYGELFRAAIEEWITSGGNVGTMVTLVNACQGTDPTARHFLFQEFVQTHAFTCGWCEGRFSIDSAGVEEEDHVLCPRCHNG